MVSEGSRGTIRALSCKMGARGKVVVEALDYKAEDREFDTR
jgi:hypothetical protein